MKKLIELIESKAHQFNYYARRQSEISINDTHYNDIKRMLDMLESEMNGIEEVCKALDYTLEIDYRTIIEGTFYVEISVIVLDGNLIFKA